MYITDSFTGLYNRYGFEKHFPNMIQQAKKGKNCISSVICDLDRLKYINDSFGHNEGDNAIKVAADALKCSVPDNAICMRFGGDEMTTFFIGECSNNISNSMENYFKSYNSNSNKNYTVHASIGIFTTYDENQMTYETLLKKADEILYVNKKRVIKI